MKKEKFMKKRSIAFLLCILPLLTVTPRAEGMLKKVFKMGAGFWLKARPMPSLVQNNAHRCAKAMGVEFPEQHKELNVGYNLKSSWHMFLKNCGGGYFHEGETLFPEGGIAVLPWFPFLPSWKREFILAHEIVHADDDNRDLLFLDGKNWADEDPTQEEIERADYRADKKAMIVSHKLGNYKGIEKCLKKRVKKQNHNPYSYGTVSGFLTLLEKYPNDENLQKILETIESKKQWSTWLTRVGEKNLELQEYDLNLFPEEWDSANEEDDDF